MLNFGADKISINTPALARPDLIDELAKRFGSQCVVVGIDSRVMKTVYISVYQNTGDPDKTSDTNRETTDWVRRGAGTRRR